MANVPNGLVNMVLGMVKGNPNIANNPMAQEYLSIIESGDSARGEEIARNLCRSNGVSPDQATQSSIDFFMKGMGGR